MKDPSGIFSVSPNVWKLGFTSLFTDISSEMLSSILPLYFMLYLNLSPLRFGVLDGVYQGAAVALLGLAAGIAADRWRRQKEVAASGYAFSALSKLGLVLVGGSWALVVAALMLDRFGKGVRTAPRDALISLSSNHQYLATAFAVHRFLDTGGAVLGPFVAFLLLWIVPNRYDLLLLCSFFIALIGVGSIVLLVQKPPQLSWDRPGFPSSQLLNQLWLKSSLPRLALTGGVLALTTASDAFIYLLLLKNTSSSGAVLPLFAVITATVYMLLSIPVGKLADAWGRRRVFLLGHALLLGAYLILAKPELGKVVQFSSLGLLGTYYAATDGVLAALGSAILPPQHRTTGLAVLNTFLSVGKFCSSLLFGLLWTLRGMRAPIWLFAAGLFLALLASANILRKTAA